MRGWGKNILGLKLTETSFLETVSLRLEIIMDVIVVRPLGRVGREEREEVYWLS